VESSFAHTAWVFSRAISLIYAIAFLSIIVQARGLWGSTGILPISHYADLATNQLGLSRFYVLPSFFYITAADWAIVGFAVLGTVAAALAFFGFAQGWMLLLCYLLYLSYVSMGQDFLSFQWDVLLLEVGFLALFVVPWRFGFFPWLAVEPHQMVIWIFYLVIFKLMLLSGLAKIWSGDESWRNFTALTYHYWTQPIPNFIAAFLHGVPVGCQKISTVIMFLIELVFPFLILAAPVRFIAGLGFIFLNVMIILSGNFAFFNWLTIALSLWLLPNSWFHSLKFLPTLEITANAPSLVVMPVMLYLAVASLFWLTRHYLPPAMENMLRPLVRATASFSLSNSYGLFASMTKDRLEIVIEGSDDGIDWQEYEFKYKPGDVKRMPPWMAPHQPRLDWQMWFAALGRYEDSPWLDHFMAAVQSGSPEVLALLNRNPFPKKPPQFLRAQLYRYEFLSPSQIIHGDGWWKRTFVGNFSPVFKLR
jgi:hypothetical protein